MTDKEISIRDFRRGDAKGVVDLVLGIQNDEFELNLTICDQKDLEDIEAYYCKNDGAFFVAETPGDGIIGTIGLLRLREDVGVMKKFFVAAPYRGGRSGVAKALYDRFLSFARSAGVRQIVLDTPSAATRSHGFYRAAGFAQIDRSQLPMLYDFPERYTLFFKLDL